MFSNVIPVVGGVIYAVFLVGDIALWRLGLKYIKRQQENSLQQAHEAALNDVEAQIHSNLNFDNEYKQIDWNAGNKQ